MDWKEALVKIIDMITEDKLAAMVCLTLLGIATITKYPVQESLPILTGIISGIAGFVTGVAMSKNE